MADDDKYNKDGFKLGPKGGVLADPGANLSDNRDFESWDWKQIKAAIVGYAAVPSDGIPHSTPFSDPDSLRYASVVINRARAGLDYLADNIKMQSEALAGENGAWKSGAADAFRSMTLLFAAKLKSKAEQINGGESVGTNNVPSQLWTSGNYLQWAKDTINWIDGYYASWVATNGTQMGNGLARISDYPELVTQMGDDMKKVVRILAGQYVLNTDKVTPPNPADFDFKKDPKLGDDNSGGPKPPPNLTNPPPGGGDAAKKPPSIDAPPPTGGPTGGGGPKSPPSLNAPKPPSTGAGNFAAKPPSVDAPPGTGGANVPKPPSVNAPPGTGGANAPKPPSVNVPAPPGTGGANGPKPPSVNAPPGTGGANVPKPPSVNAPPGTGGANVPKPPSVNVPAPPGTGGKSGGGANVPKPVNVPSPVKSGGGSGPGAGLKPPAPLNVSAPPGAEAGAGNPRGNVVKPPVPHGAEWQAPRSASGTGQSGPGVPPPAVPPGAGGGQPAAADRPDSAGLLGGETAPWEGATPPSVGGPSEVPSAAAKPEEWAAPPANAPGIQAPGAGFQPPMVPPGAGGAGQPSAADRPDSAGLLGGETEPWLSGADDSGEIGADYAPSSKPESWASAADPVPADAEEEPVVPMISAPVGPPVSDVEPEAEEDAGERAAAVPREAEMSAVPAAPPSGWAVTAGKEPGEDEPWEISLPPAAAPEGWAARSDGVSPDASAPTTAAALVAGAATAAGAMTPAAPTAASSTAPRTRPPEPTPARDADRDSGRAFPVPGIDSVVVVRAAEAVRDTKAWDTGAKDLVLPAAPLPPAVVSSGPPGWGDDFPAVTPRATEPVGPEPEPTAHATYRRKKPGEAAKIVDSWEPPPSCGDEYSVPPEDREAYLASLNDEPEEADEETEAEPAERSAADLLNASDSSWGGSGTARPTGVLE
ncbi:hypothetical protein ACH347_23995 [Saccharopolyspora sp. 5N102]|uniref:hypothetical protein n=1 Tax=Saccharopolyspora sp. 5N102 TaxID=3375155 RepID=UPI0037AD8603